MTSRTGSKTLGLTLVELLVSIALLAVGAVSVTHALVQVSYAQQVSEGHAQAQLLALEQMAQLELAVQGGDTLEEPPAGRARVGRRTFHWAVLAAPLPEDPQLRAVSLTVEWEQGTRHFTRQLDTILRIPAVEPA